MGIKPILFSAPMVRALLDGRKTQTRRLLNPQPDGTPEIGIGDHPTNGTRDKDTGIFTPDIALYVDGKRLPYAPNNLLYVREAWRTDSAADWLPPRELSPMLANIVYEAGGGTKVGPGGMHKGRLRPGIHMPRWASRITLTVTDVKVERVQDIGINDACAEGIDPLGQDDPVDAFRALWDSLHKPQNQWEANPWVSATTFTVEQRNVDA